MNSNTQQQIKRLFKLVELSHELGDLVNFKLIDQWNSIREEHGLAQTLTLIQQYVNENPTQTPVSEVANTNQNAPLVQ